MPARRMTMKRLMTIVAICAAMYAGTCTPAELSAQSTSKDKAAIEAAVERYRKAFEAKDVNAVMENYAPGAQLFVFDAIPPRDYPSWDAYRKDWEGLFAAFPGPLHYRISDMHITVVGPVAYSHRIETGHFTQADGASREYVVRVTDVYRKMHGKWLVVQEHVSFPVDLMTGKADLLSRP